MDTQGIKSSALQYDNWMNQYQENPFQSNSFLADVLYNKMCKENISLGYWIIIFFDNIRSKNILKGALQVYAT